MNDPAHQDPTVPGGDQGNPSGTPRVVGRQFSPVVESVKVQSKQRRKRPGLSPWRTIVDIGVVLLLVVVSDLLVFQSGAQYTSVAICVGFWAAVIVVVKWKRVLPGPAICVLIPMLAVLAKIVWCGNVLAVLASLGLLGCIAMTAASALPWLPEAFLIYPCALSGGVERAMRFRLTGASAAIDAASDRAAKVGGISAVLIPAAILLVFSGLFVLANPDLQTAFQARIEWVTRQVGEYLQGVNVGQIACWGAAAWMGLGLLYPFRAKRLRSRGTKRVDEPTNCGQFAVYRNTLLSVICLFAIYLVFEFGTLWFRELPEDFYYAGYAHQGAFWLTVALALSTATLSVIFNASTSADPRRPALTRLALIWSALNFVLSIAVVNRLWIYVEYNGLTRMRIVGFLGIAAVVAGFALVVYKVCRQRDFVWLLHRQLWCPTAALICYAIMPVDWIATTYNVTQARSGATGPVVQLAAHEFSAEGALPLIRLLDHDDAVIRNGARGLIAESFLRLPPEGPDGFLPKTQSTRYVPWMSGLGHSSPWLSDRARRLVHRFDAPEETTASGAKWLRFQAADALLRREVGRRQLALRPFVESPQLRYEAIDSLYKYAYQWY